MPRSIRPRAISRAMSQTWRKVIARHSPSTLCFCAILSPYSSAALGSRSAIVLEPVDCRGAVPASICPPRELLGIQPVEEVSVLLVDHVALHLQRRRQLARLLAQIVVEDLELLDLRDLGVVGI